MHFSLKVLIHWAVCLLLLPLRWQPSKKPTHEREVQKKGLHAFGDLPRVFVAFSSPKGFCYPYLIQEGFFQFEFELPRKAAVTNQEELLVRPVLRFVTGVTCECGYVVRHALQEPLICIIIVVFISKCKLIAYHRRKLYIEALENINI